jgi:NTE family protein
MDYKLDSFKFGRKKVGLVLGSGSQRGLAHIGVIKVLEENNIPIDFIAGSSAGALIGGFYAATKDIKKMEGIALTASWKQLMNLIDPSFKKGLLGGKKVKKFIEDYLGDITFKDLKIPFAAIATNLKTGEIVSVREGEVASAIRASISLPLIFEPIERDGKILADGGLAMPVPVEVVREMGAEAIIAVTLDTDYFNDYNSKLGFYEIASNSINIMRQHLSLSDVKSADIVISPRVGDVTLNKILNGKEVILEGERATKAVLSEIKKLIK